MKKIFLIGLSLLLLSLPAYADIERKVKVSSNDTTSGYLNGKLVEGTGISFTEGSDGGNETLTITNSATTADGAGEFVYIEGSTSDGFEVILGADDPTADRDVNFPNDDIAAGDVLVGDGADSIAYVALATTEILIGDGSGAPTAAALSSDVTMDNTGAVTIANNAVALGTDTTGNYVATIADAGNSTVTVANSGSETAAITLDAVDVNCSNCIDGTDIALGSDASGDIMYYNGTDYVRLAKGTDGQFLSLASGVPDWDTPAGAGDVASAGDCTSDACGDGTSDGGTYYRLYDGDSNYTQISPSDTASNITVTLPGVTGTLITSGQIDTYSELNAIVADQTLTHNGLIDTYAELNTIVADQTLTHNALIDTYSELNAIVADVTLTHNGLIDTFAEIDAIVADESLVNTNDTQTLTGKTLNGDSNDILIRSHATDCTALTDGKEDELCLERDDDTIYSCEPSAGDCDTAGEWTSFGGSGESTTAGRSLTLNVAEVDADAELYTTIFNISIFNPSTSDDALKVIKIPQAFTITEISCFTDTGTVDVQFDERAETTPNTGGTDVMAAALQCDNDQAEQTSFDNASLDAADWLNMDVDAVASSPTKVNVTVKGTWND